jgi:VWFA-related protein
MKWPRIALGAVLFFALAAAGTAWGQAPPGPLHPNPNAKPEQVPTKELAKNAIKVRVNEVVAPVTVTDPKGEMILSLNKDQFHVFDNGVEQKIDHFDVGGDPLSIVLIFETSSHIEPMMPAVRRTGVIFTEQVMALTSEVAIIGYDDSVDTLQKFTTEPETIQNTIENLRLGTSGMRLYDAMTRGILMLKKRPAVRRRIMVVIGEAQDKESENALGEVLRSAQLANVTIYSVGLSTALADLRAKPKPQQTIGPPGTFPVPTPNGQPQTPSLEEMMQQSGDLMALAVWLVKTGKNALGPNSLAIASKATGGMHENIKKDGSIQKAVDQIGGEIHAQYSLGYRPRGNEPSGYHEIKVTVDPPGLSVRTRPGYYIPPPES